MPTEAQDQLTFGIPEQVYLTLKPATDQKAASSPFVSGGGAIRGNNGVVFFQWWHETGIVLFRGDPTRVYWNISLISLSSASELLLVAESSIIGLTMGERTGSRISMAVCACVDGMVVHMWNLLPSRNDTR